MVLTFDDEREENGKIVECEKVIQVGMPKKRVFSALLDMQELMDMRDETHTEKEKIEINKKIIDELYDLTAEILSNNLKGERITTEWVEDQLSTEELQFLFTQYVKFVNGEASSPN